MATSPNHALLAQFVVDKDKRPKYQPAQIREYFQRINLPPKYTSSPVVSNPRLAQSKEHGLSLLAALHRHHVSSIPFENLELHYSSHRTISLDMDTLFDKFVSRGISAGRGGRCMENNGFFGTMLRSLGYEVQNCGGRVSRMMSPNQETRHQQGNTYDGWNHMLNLVLIEDQWWVVDVGMGAMGPNCIYPLQDGLEVVAIPPRKIRLQLRVIPEHAAMHERDARKLWCYDVCHHPASSTESSEKDHWIPTYCFTETEFLPQDYEMMSWYTSTHPRSFFTYSVLCTKLLLDEGQDHVIGDVTLFNNEIRQTIAGQRKLLASLKNEEERVLKLRDMFGVQLSEEEKSAIGANVMLGEAT